MFHISLQLEGYSLEKIFKPVNHPNQDDINDSNNLSLDRISDQTFCWYQDHPGRIGTELGRQNKGEDLNGMKARITVQIKF